MSVWTIMTFFWKEKVYNTYDLCMKSVAFANECQQQKVGCSMTA